MFQETFLNMKDVCAVTGLCRGTIQSEVNNGRLRSMKVGPRRLVTTTALKDWIQQSEMLSTEASIIDLDHLPDGSPAQIDWICDLEHVAHGSPSPTGVNATAMEGDE